MQAWAAPLWTVAALYVVGFMGFAAVAGPGDLLLSSNLHSFDALGLILAFLVLISVGALMIVPAVLAWRERRFAHAHRDETLRMNERGVVYASDDQRIEATWSEVRHVERRAKERGSPSGHRVITENGEFTLWTTSVNPAFVSFRRRCESYAPNALTEVDAQDKNLSFDAEINPVPPGADGDADVFVSHAAAIA